MNSVPFVVNKDEDHIKVSNIYYSYDNEKILTTLFKRGKLIKEGTIEANKACCSKEKIDPVCLVN